MTFDLAKETWLSPAIDELRAQGMDTRVLRTDETGKSRVAFLEDSFTGRPLVLKVRKPENEVRVARFERSLDTETEYRLIAAIHEHFAALPSLRNSVPAPVCLLNSCEGIVVSCLPGGSLKSYLVQHTLRGISGLRRSQAIGVIEACGSWLRAFHAMPAPASLTQPGLTSELKTRAATAAADLPPQIVEACGISKTVYEPGELALDSQCLLSHGDFNPGNILVQNGEVGVIDVTKACVAPPEEDIAFFLTNLCLQKEFVVGGGLLAPAQAIRELVARFLLAYFMQQGQIDTSSLKVFLSVHLLERSVQMRKTASPLPAVLRPLIDRLVAGSLRQACRLLFEDILNE